MATLKIFQKGAYVNNHIKYVADTEEDVKTIKILPNGGSMGNEVYVIAIQKTYILDSKKTWHSKRDNDDDSIECDCVEESTIWDEIPESRR